MKCIKSYNINDLCLFKLHPIIHINDFLCNFAPEIDYQESVYKIFRHRQIIITGFDKLYQRLSGNTPTVKK